MAADLGVLGEDDEAMSVISGERNEFGSLKALGEGEGVPFGLNRRSWLRSRRIREFKLRMSVIQKAVAVRPWG